MGRDFKYDVAFSFCYEDEKTATEIADRIRDRVGVFLCSEQQKQLIGRDGEEAFSAVYAQEARTVAILYRPKWGTTPFTRIEETAIRNRAFDEGYDFTTFVSLDDSTVPKWLPKPRLWLGLHRQGIAGAAAILEARIQESGGSIHEESVENHIERVARAVERRSERESWLISDQGAKAAHEAVEALFAYVKSKVDLLRQAQSAIKIEFESISYEVFAAVRTPLVSTTFAWDFRYSNSTRDAGLHVCEYDGVYLMGRRSDERLARTSETTFLFSVNEQDAVGWRPEGDDVQFYDSQHLADRYLKQLFDRFNAASAARVQNS